MKKKYIILLAFLIILLNVLVFRYWNLVNTNITLSYKLISDKQDIYQVFYGSDTAWKEENSQKVNYIDANKQEALKYTIPKETLELRFDLGNQASNINISDIKLSYLGKSVDLDMNQMLDKSTQVQIGKIQKVDKSFDIETIGNDPYIIYKLDASVLTYFDKYQNIMNNILKVVICIAVNVVLFMSSRKWKSILLLVQELNGNKALVWDLSKNDFKTKYAGSYLGIFWAFVQPIITVITYWFVFQVGFRSAPMNDFPFLLWLVVGLVPWFLFSEAITNATSAMIEYSYLVKKVLFKISILPIVKIISALFVHFFFIIFTIILFAIYGYFPSIHMIQIIYYTACILVLALGISYATSAIMVFFKDLGQIVAIILQIGIWFTPIMWSYSIIPSRYQWIFKLNPMYYIVEGYRDSFINHVWLIERYNQTIYFWVITIAMFVIGTAIFKKLKVHFADVL